MVLLLVGVWFGGHPSWLPAPLRSAFVSKTANERLVQTTLDLIAKDYYRKVDTKKLLNTGLEAAVASLDDPYSHYYPPSLYTSFEQETNPQVAGIGVEPAPEPVDGGLRSKRSSRARLPLRRGCVMGTSSCPSAPSRSTAGPSRRMRS